MNLRLLLASSLLGATLTACNVGNPPAPISSIYVGSPTGASSSIVSSTAVAAGQAISLSSALQAASGISSFTPVLPSGLTSSAGNATYAVSSAAPGGVPTLQVQGPQAQSAQSSATVSGATDLLFLSVTPTVATNLGGTYSLSFTFANGASPNTSYYLAVYNGSTWTANAANGAGTVAGSTLTFNGSFPAGLTLSTGTPYVIGLYSIATPSVATTGSIPLQTTGPVAAVTGTVYGGTESLMLPNASIATTLNYSLSTTAPSGVTPPSSGVSTVLGYATVTSTAATSFAPGAQAIFTYSPTAGGVAPTLNLAYSVDGQNWVTGVASSSSGGSATSTLTFAAPATISLSGGTPYYLALYQ